MVYPNNRGQLCKGIPKKDLSFSQRPQECLGSTKDASQPQPIRSCEVAGYCSPSVRSASPISPGGLCFLQVTDWAGGSFGRAGVNREAALTLSTIELESECLSVDFGKAAQVYCQSSLTKFWCRNRRHINSRLQKCWTTVAKNRGVGRDYYGRLCGNHSSAPLSHSQMKHVYASYLKLGILYLGVTCGVGGWRGEGGGNCLNLLRT